MFSSAIIPSHVSGLALPLRLLAAFAAGVMLSAGFYLLFFCLDDHVRTADDLAMASDAPVLAAIPRRKGKEMLTGEKEQACMVASRLLNSGVKCVLVSAPHSGEGVSLVCADLVQAVNDLHHLALWIRVEHRSFWNHHAEPTLEDYLEDRCSWKDLVQPYEGGALLAVCGTEDELPSQLFHPRMAVLMQKLCATYDVILVDVPPIDQRADGSAFFRFCNGCVLVSACGRSTFHEISAYAALLAESGHPLLGSVLNGVHVKHAHARFSTRIVKESQAA